jgi:hypothetical protein
LAIIQVETGGREINPMEISEAYLIDSGLQYDLNQINTEESYLVFVAYMERYATPKRLGREVTVEDIARIHNGGPNGWKKGVTEGYGERVVNLYELLESDGVYVNYLWE